VASTNKLAPAIFVALLAVVAIAVVIAIRGCGPDREEPEEGIPAASVVPTPEPTPTLQERLSARLKGTTLNTSDEVIRELVAALSSRPELAAWLANEDLVRRFVAAVNNIADGGDPRQHVEFLRPDEPFSVTRSGGRTVIDAASYRRYDAVTGVFVSLDTRGTIELLAELEPLIDDAHAEIAPPGSSFDDRLRVAIDELLEVPVPAGEVEVRPKVMTFAYADEELEGLSAAQRQLLRMGPDNVRAIQAKLRELRAGLPQ
jgi:hypothetical protein